MPPPREPCHCKRCNGALVSRRTVNRHRPARTPIPTYDEWLAATQLARAEREIADGLRDESQKDDAGGVAGRERRRKWPRMDGAYETNNSGDATNPENQVPGIQEDDLERNAMSAEAARLGTRARLA